MARFFLPKKNIDGNRGFIQGQELQHLRRVLRLAPGDGITVFDDAGREHEAVIRSFGSESAEIEIIRSREAPRESPLDLSLALGLTKGDKMDFVVEKATELGVCRIVPFISVHAVTKLDAAKAEKRAARWQKIALSAAKQCGRTRIPEILPLCEFRDLSGSGLAGYSKIIFLGKRSPPVVAPSARQASWYRVGADCHWSRRGIQRCRGPSRSGARIRNDFSGPTNSSGRNRRVDGGLIGAVSLGRLAIACPVYASSPGTYRLSVAL